MSERVWCGVEWRRARKTVRGRYRPGLESLERRQVLNASLAALPDVSALLYEGYQVPLNGSGSAGSQQSFTVTSSNPDIKASVNDCCDPAEPLPFSGTW